MLEATLTTLEGLDETLHDNYETTSNGGFKLKLLSDYTPNADVEDVTGLKSALGKERDNNKTATRQLREFQEKFGDIDPEEFQRLREAETEANTKKLEDKGQYDTLLNQVKEQHGTEIDKHKKREEHLLAQLRKKTVDAEVESALNEFKGNANLLRPHVRDQVVMIEDENGEIHNRVIDKSGNHRVNGEGVFLTVPDLVSEMRDQETYASAFDPDVKSGAGTAQGGQGQGQGSKPGVIPADLKRSDMKPVDKVAFIREHGNEVFQNLPA